jgi:hypothetical protein
VRWGTTGFSPFIGARGGQQPVVKVEEWQMSMGMKQLTLNCHFTPRSEEGRRGNGRGMRCGAQGSIPMASEAGVALEGGSSLLLCMSHPFLRLNRMLIVCLPRNQVYTHTIQKMDTE